MAGSPPESPVSGPSAGTRPLSGAAGTRPLPGAAGTRPLPGADGGSFDARAILRGRLVAAMPRVLGLLDRNPLSPTFGSFDRRYWHYKVSDFPCGMQQELVFPMAHLWSVPFDGNPYHGEPRIAAWIRAAFRHHGAIARRDGSLDDYFPGERALGATAYALAALTETALLTGLADGEDVAAFERSGRFLASFRERGLLANHWAIAACALINLHALTGDAAWRLAAAALVERLAGVQHDEGWFPEYEGCDPGYQTVTIEFLARYRRRSDDPRTADMLARALRFVRAFLHPDGSLGGEYGSRNTANFYPGGFALLSHAHPEAAEILHGFFQGVAGGTENHLLDDGVFGHLLSSGAVALAAPALTLRAPDFEAPDVPVRHFPGAGLFVGRTGPYRIYGAGSKGGVVRIFRNGRLVCADTGFAGRLDGGVAFCQNNPGAGSATAAPWGITVTGRLRRLRRARLDPFRMLVLRALSLAFGRWPFYSHAIRRLMQGMLIYDRGRLNLPFRRVVRIGPDGITLEDTLGPVGTGPVAALYRSTDCVNMHVITSASFQMANLRDWTPLDPPEPGGTRTYRLVLGMDGAEPMPCAD